MTSEVSQQEVHDQDLSQQAQAPQERDQALAMRRGLTEAEAVIARLHAKFGSDDTVLDHLDPLAKRPMQEVGARLEACADRDATLDVWAQRDNARRDVLDMAGRAKGARCAHHLGGLSARWQRAAASMQAHPDAWGRGLGQRAMVHLVFHGLAYGSHQLDPALIGREGVFDLGFLCTIHHQARDQILQRIGVYQLAQVLRTLDRRRIARILRELPAELQQWMRADFARERDTHELELARIKEVFVGLQKRHQDWRALARHMGLFFVATSAGSRFTTRMDRLGQLLPKDQAHALAQYADSARWSSRRGLDDIVRTSLGALWPDILSIQESYLGATL